MLTAIFVIAVKSSTLKILLVLLPLIVSRSAPRPRIVRLSVIGNWPDVSVIVVAASLASNSIVGSGTGIGPFNCLAQRPTPSSAVLDTIAASRVRSSKRS